MKRFFTSTSFILIFALMLGVFSVNAAERPYAASGNGVATFIIDDAGNVVGANLSLGGNGTHLGLFTGTGKIDFVPDANDPNIVIVPGEITYVAANGDRLPTIIENGRMDLRTGIATGDMVFQSGTGRFEGASGRAANCRRAELHHGRLHVHHGWKRQLLTQPDEHTDLQVGLAATPAFNSRPYALS